MLYKPDIAQNTLNAQRFLSHIEPLLDLVTFGSGPDHNPLGKWVSSNVRDPKQCQENVFVSMSPLLDPYLLAHLNAMKAFQFENADDIVQLIKIFFTKFNPVLPLVDEQKFMESYEQSKYSIPLLHAITLAACRHPDAAKHLGKSKNVREFAALTSRKIEALLNAEIESDPLTIIQIYALLSLHAEGPDGFQKAAKFKCLASHHAHCLGIHLDHSNENVDKMSSRIWKSIWILDVLLICLNSLPTSTHLRDIPESTMGDNGDPNYDLVNECKKLEKIIDFYRPNGAKDQFLEILEGESPPDDGSSKAALMLLIHYISLILGFKKSCIPGYSPEDIANILLSTSFKIIDLVETRELPPFPVVPSAVSLTLTVFLRYFMQSRERDGWKRACALLEVFTPVWSAADVMHDLCFNLFTKLETDCGNEEQKSPIIDPYVIEMFGDGLTSGFLEQQGLFTELDLEDISGPVSSSGEEQIL